MTDTKQAKVEHAYVSAHAVATELLDEIMHAIQNLPSPDSRPVHWGHVGDLQHINSLLAQVTGFFEAK